MKKYSCAKCGNTENLKTKKIKFKKYSLDAVICPRCWNVSLVVDEKTKKTLLKEWAKKEESKALSIIVKEMD